MNASSKILMVCGFCISFGIYVSNIQRANVSIVDVGQQRSYYTQARMNANVGLYYVMNKMAAPSWFNSNKGVTETKVFGGETVQYRVDKIGPSDTLASVTITTKFNNVIARQRTIIQKSALPTDQNLYNANYFDASGKYSTWKVKQTYFYPSMLTSTEGSL
jgi:hypothetical protein